MRDVNCKTVKERIFECNLDELNNEFFLFFKNEDRLELTGEHKKKFRKLIGGIRTITPLKSNEVINAEIYQVSSEIRNNQDKEYLSVNEKGIDLREIDIYVTKPDDEEKYSFMLTEWEESLGYLVPEYLVQKFGLETITAVILYEMTWWGCSAEEVHEAICRDM